MCIKMILKRPKLQTLNVLLEWIHQILHKVSGSDRSVLFILYSGSVDKTDSHLMQHKYRIQPRGVLNVTDIRGLSASS